MEIFHCSTALNHDDVHNIRTHETLIVNHNTNISTRTRQSSCKRLLNDHTRGKYGGGAEEGAEEEAEGAVEGVEELGSCE